MDEWLTEFGNIDYSEYHELMRQSEKYSPKNSGPQFSTPESFPDEKLHFAMHQFHRNDTDNFHMTKGFRKELQHEMGLPDSSSGTNESPKKLIDQKASKNQELQHQILKVCQN
jgi:hypothetical protein